MKKFLFLIVTVILTISPLFAFTDSFYENAENENYKVLISAIKNNESEDVVLALYDSYRSSESDPVNLTRIEYQMVRYLKDRGDETRAESHFALCKEDYAAITEEGVRKDVAEAEMISADYYIYKKMGTGMDSSSKTKKLYKAYPDEITVILQEANRLLYSPHIAGGSPKKALALFETLLPYEAEMQEIDRFTLYAGLGMAAKERNKDSEAIDYLNTAINIFSGDNVLISALDELT